MFDAIYRRSLVHNSCWEDPAADRQALALRPDDRMLIITSAGCGVLDYALTGLAHIHAVDANPRQSSLLELKLAGIQRLDYADFFSLFGRALWPWWFRHDGVRISAEHLHYLLDRLMPMEVREESAAVPYLPGLAAPCYVLVARKPGRGHGSDASA